MSVETTSANPIVKAIVTGTAPRPARLAAARGILPLPPEEMLETLIALAAGEDNELATNAAATLAAQNADNLHGILQAETTAPQILAHFAERENLSLPTLEILLSNLNTPDASIVKFARKTKESGLLELISFNQQRLIRTPQILDAIIANPYRSAEAERRAAEIKREFFEKERGAQQIAAELRAQGLEAAAEFIEKSDFAENPGAFALTAEDAALIARHIETPDSEIDDSWLALAYIEEFYEETDEQRQAIVDKIIGEFKVEDDVSTERISMINRILRMNMKDRVKLAMKGDREARNILIRDPNRIVAQAVMQNPRITEQEVEKIAAMRTVPEDVLRQIAAGRQWSRVYGIVHNLARNPRTPLANVMGILTRLQLRDLTALTKNRNVSDNVRRQALRIASARKGA